MKSNTDLKLRMNFPCSISDGLKSDSSPIRFDSRLGDLTTPYDQEVESSIATAEDNDRLYFHTSRNIQADFLKQI